MDPRSDSKEVPLDPSNSGILVCVLLLLWHLRNPGTPLWDRQPANAKHSSAQMSFCSGGTKQQLRLSIIAVEQSIHVYEALFIMLIMRQAPWRGREGPSVEKGN